jgi:ATP phosphoribosyltransferase
MTQITLALTKGRILREVLPLLETSGIRPALEIEGSRKLVFQTNVENLRLLILRGVDVPTYVQFGAADMGIAGKDILLEDSGGGYYESLDLSLARCRLMTASLEDTNNGGGRIIVATKYINVARRYYAQKGRQAEFIKLYGAMELAPVLGLADEIVDIVDTGNTLRANGLVTKELIANVSARLIVNKVAMKTKFEVIQSIIDRLQGAL